jgi:mannosyltransferase OCH1-like enzyme
MPIPKLLHQINETKNLAPMFRPYQRQLLKIHPGWDYHLHDNIDMRNTLGRYFPSLVPIYDNYPFNVQRADLFRLVIVYVMGGFYVDLDVDCLNELDSLTAFNCVFGEEKTLTRTEAQALGHRDLLRVGNYMFGSSPGHPFLLRVVEEMVKRARTRITTENDILETTGPGLLTTVYHDNKKAYRDIVLLRNKDRKCLSPNCSGASCHFGKYANHHHIGSWRRQLDTRVEEYTSHEKQPLPEHSYKEALVSIQSRINKTPDSPFPGQGTGT